MKSLLFFVLFALQSAHAEPNSDELQIVLSDMRAGNIKSIELLHMPDAVLTRVRVCPDCLRRWASVKETFNAAQQAELQSLLATVHARKDVADSDLRWGLLLYNRDKHEVDSVFVDGQGARGYVNGHSVTFSENLSRPLHRLANIGR